MNDLLTTLTQARPTQAELDQMWPPSSRHARAETLLGSGRAGGGHRRSGRLALAAAAVVALAAVATPVVLAPDDAAAADLRALALSAAAYDAPVLAEGTWLHERSTSVQVDRGSSDGFGNPPGRYDRQRESWTSWDGHRSLIVERSPSRGWVEYSDLREEFEASYADPTPAFAATLPDDPDGLRAYLDARVQGSSSRQEAVYSALTGLVASHTLPPQTLAAAYDALAEVQDVSTDDLRVRGRAAVEITFTEDLTSSSQSLVVDRSTGQVLEMRNRSEQTDFTSSTELSEVVHDVPAGVRAAFDAHAGEGAFVESTGEPYVG